MTQAAGGQPAPPPQALGNAPIDRVQAALADPGLWLDVGAATLHVQSSCENLASQFAATYPHFPFVARGDWADIHVRIDRPAGLRRWLRPQVLLSCDGETLFEPFPASAPLPLMEWGCNWLIGDRLNHLLLLHAATLERDGRALVMPALPGSGKSTLAAALACRGWRLMSDEFGALDPWRGSFRPVLKPVALKNESIEVIRRLAPAAVIGPEFPNTRKGTVAHLAASADAVARRASPAEPGAIVLPRWQADSPTRWHALPADKAFSSMAFNAFNYRVLGEPGYDALITIARTCPAWELVYSDLDDAIGTLERHWRDSVAGWPQGSRR